MFTPAQTLVTGTLASMITDNPIGALNSHIQAAPSCEQVVVVGFNQQLGMQEYMACSTSQATHIVNWGNHGLPDTNMFMCKAHKDEFLNDCEGSEDITYVYVREL